MKLPQLSKKAAQWGENVWKDTVIDANALVPRVFLISQNIAYISE